MEPPETVKDLAAFFRKLPSIGSKTAYRLAYACLALPKEDLKYFAGVLGKAYEKVHNCPTCGLLIDTKDCPICQDPKRKKGVLLVVTDSKDVLTIESTNTYDGLYFVLKGTISPLDHRTPESIGINALKAKVAKEGIKEVIVCTNSDLEGETTALYIANSFKGTDVKVTKPASGLPSGAILEYADPLTLGKALEGRVDILGGENGKDGQDD